VQCTQVLSMKSCLYSCKDASNSDIVQNGILLSSVFSLSNTEESCVSFHYRSSCVLSKPFSVSHLSLSSVLLIFNVVDQLLELHSNTPLLLESTGLTCNMYSHRIVVVEHQRERSQMCFLFRKEPTCFNCIYMHRKS